MSRLTRVPVRERERDEDIAVRGPGLMETNRLSLHPLQRKDAEIIHPHVTENVTRLWIGWDTPGALADSQASVADALSRTAAGAYAGWLAYRRFPDSKGESRFIGVVSLERLAQPMRGAWFELNFWLAERYWGKGYAFEMAAVVLDWVASRTDLRFVTLSWTEGNEGSRSVIERLIRHQQPEVHPAMKNGISLPVYHYVLDVDGWFRDQQDRRQAYL